MSENQENNELETVETADGQPAPESPSEQDNASGTDGKPVKDAGTAPRKSTKKDPKKDAKQKKAGALAKSGHWLRSVRGEMKRVVWPSKKQVLNNTGAVLAFMLVAAVVIGAFDLLLSTLLKLAFGA